MWHCAILLDLTSVPGFTAAVNCVIVREHIQEHIKNAPRSLSGPGQLSWYSDLLQAGQSGDRILMGARFSAPVEISPGAHPASYTMGTRSSLQIKRPGHGIDHPPPFSAKV